MLSGTAGGVPTPAAAAAAAAVAAAALGGARRPPVVRCVDVCESGEACDGCEYDDEGTEAPLAQ
jgi:hypothetical protein